MLGSLVRPDPLRTMDGLADLSRLSGKHRKGVETYLQQATLVG